MSTESPTNIPMISYENGVAALKWPVNARPPDRAEDIEASLVFFERKSK
jgi:hypothetical protein